MKTAPSRRAQVCAWTCKTPLNRLGATSRRHDLNPAEAYGALAGKRSEPLRLGVRAHTHALCALKVQPKLSNGVAGFTAGGSSLDQRVREGAGCWPPGPSCVSPAPQLKREWSPWPEFGWFPA